MSRPGTLSVDTLVKCDRARVLLRMYGMITEEEEERIGQRMQKQAGRDGFGLQAQEAYFETPQARGVGKECVKQDLEMYNEAGQFRNTMKST